MKSNRIDILDLWRTIAIVCMIVYHLLFDLYIFGALSGGQMFSVWLNTFERFICVSFILLSGISSRLSRGNIKRGCITLVCALLVSAAGYIVDQPIWFGILHFLGCAMIIYGLAGRFLEKIPRTPRVWIYSLLFVALLGTLPIINPVGIGFLFPLGFTSASFASADYFPILPWIFMFLLGTFLGGELLKRREIRVFSLSLPTALTWPGRHSLIIYLLHQPVLYGLTYLFRVISQTN
jgi:uncharacterized membrane protein